MFPKIMVVDDATWIHSLLQVHFKRERIKMHSAYDGASALEAMTHFKPDLVLLDVDMPGMDGFEVCRKIRENPFTMNVPIIFLTAAGGTGQKVSGLDLGAQDYIVKPFEPTELLARVRASLRIKDRCDTLSQMRVTQFLGSPRRETVQTA